ncbi:methionine ABC transporter ATP-binding protein [Alkalicella caledoniensis]|uniref:Methionine ABC transporter ATP-binding protein n=1 Tax=Alkalicella caledoniensis TaxID=2731377 RepID=A0A7G9WA22_ALKCA|nr:methionine ABC transporter ATP-binding protein [Alkalicella caledoniensis]QNO15534.1 methionine ABC transporter ATP-binding protein [Alkalicella caledoniensis]
MILLENITKTYGSKGTAVHALKNVNLHVEQGDIYGIIGYSGAGKSTLIRCINLLESPDEGKVTVNGIELTALKDIELRRKREKIGMIFQHFNLMSRRTIFSNVAYPLKGKGLTKKQIEEKVINLLKLVGIQDKANAYPAQLSGGQKQRVGIARALANDPDVLLCDEATSALDPQTTRSILNLLKDINEKLNLTIVLITHQMDVIKEICNKVAVMENGEIVEVGDVLNVFFSPQAKITKEFVASTMGYESIDSFLEYDLASKPGEVQRLVKISFMGKKTSQAFISKISMDYGVFASILFGNIEHIQGVPLGNLIIRLSGTEEKTKKAIGYLTQNNIKVEVLSDGGVFETVDAQRHQSIS